jgi:hypothetical protein
MATGSGRVRVRVRPRGNASEASGEALAVEEAVDATVTDDVSGEVPDGEALAELALADATFDGAAETDGPEGAADAVSATAPASTEAPDPAGADDAVGEYGAADEDDDLFGMGEALASIEALFGENRIVLIEDDGLTAGALMGPAGAGAPAETETKTKAQTETEPEERRGGYAVLFGRSLPVRLETLAAGGVLCLVMLAVAFLLGRGSVPTTPSVTEIAHADAPAADPAAAGEAAPAPRRPISLGIAASIPAPTSGRGSTGATPQPELDSGSVVGTQLPEAPAATSEASAPRWQIMVMSHVPKRGAEEVQAFLADKGYKTYIQPSGRVYNVRVGDYHDKGSEAARRDLDALRALPFKGKLEFKSAWFVRWKRAS